MNSCDRILFCAIWEMGFGLPENASLVWEGELFKVYTREQTLFDGRVTTFESVQRYDSVHGLVVKDKKLLICRQKQPHKPNWYTSLICGRVPWGLDPLEHMKTELREETGMVSDEIQLWDADHKNGALKYMTWYYTIKNPIIVGQQQLDPGGEIVEPYRVDFETFVDMILHQGLDRTWLRYKLQTMMLEGTLDDFKTQLFG